MDNWICITCGTQYPASEKAPQGCPICLDERQYVRHEGQAWTTMAAMQQEGFHNSTRPLEAGLIGIGTEPDFAIAQRAMLVQTEKGNVLWECLSYLDDETVAAVQQLGGIAAIAISHPHFYSSMVDWAERFDVPIYLHDANRQWVMRPDERITFWSGETYPLFDGVTLVLLGGHFPGSTVLHWSGAADGKGVLLTGDTISVVPDWRWVSFMWSYPNLIPLPASEVRQICERILPYDFDRIYSSWYDRVLLSDARNAVKRSAERYIRALEGRLHEADEKSF
jgi:glyoxylase-like metal-dependent hydrolase (beta-lactamase superfamily II)